MGHININKDEATVEDTDTLDTAKNDDLSDIVKKEELSDIVKEDGIIESANNADGGLTPPKNSKNKDAKASQPEPQRIGRVKAGETLKVTGFCKRYGNSQVFAGKDVSLEVKSGEVFGFLGPNGAGKSTLIKSIVGIQPLTAGKIEICGFDIEKQSVEAKRNIGFVPDHYALYENLTGREYVNYIADLYRVPSKERHERIERLIDTLQLKDSFDSLIKTYSHGMKQKVAVISVLVHDPKLWILDEPLTGLDPTSIYNVKELMKAHAEAGNIVFFSSHIIDVVEKLCDRIAIIKKGEIAARVDMRELERDGIPLERFYMSVIGADGGGQ